MANVEGVEDTIVKRLYRIEPASEAEIEERRRARAQATGDRFQFSAPPKTTRTKPATVTRKGEKVGRNDPCPCGSGKKYKKCHGAPAGVSA